VENKKKGNKGEDQAAEYCIALGYEVLYRQYRNRFGEIDLICKDKDTVIFIEVKNWDTLGMDSLEYSINYKKQRTIHRMAEHFILENEIYDKWYKRFDLVFVSGRTSKLEHIIDAF